MNFGTQDIALISVAGAFGLMAGMVLCSHAARGAKGMLVRPGRASRLGAGLVCGVACASLAGVYGFAPQTIELVLLACVLCHLSLVDLDRRCIPNEDIACACAIRLAYLGLGMVLGWPDVRPAYYLASAVGVLAVLLASVLAADRLLESDSMGGGDLKLFAACALYLGWVQSLVLVFVSCVLGLASSLVLLRSEAGEERQAHTFPFGPSIALSCWLCLLFGGAWNAWPALW